MGWFDGVTNLIEDVPVLSDNSGNDWEAFDTGGSFFDSVGDYATSFSEWMGKYPVAADFIKGAAGAGLSYYAQKEAQENALQLEQRRYENSLAKAPASNGNYGSHNASLTNGLLSKGVFKKGVSS